MLSRINPIALYLGCLGLTIGAYSLYAIALVPLIEGNQPPPPEHVTKPGIDYRETNTALLEVEHLFAPDSWQREDPITLKTPQGIYLFQKHQNLPNGDVLVTPLTMVLTGTDDGEQSPPIILHASDGARLKLSHPIDGSLADSQKPELEKAQLLGDVLVTQQASPINEQLEIRTRNIQIEKQLIRTLEAVSFQFGKHHATGRTLNIQLNHERKHKALATGFSSIKGISSIELAFLDKLVLHPTDKTISVTRSQLNSPLAMQKSPLEVTCKGPFVFDYDQQVATFSNQVVVRQLDESGDNLQCEELGIYFERGDAATPNSLGAQMSLKAMVARGAPFVLDAPSRESKVTGQYLNYDLKKNLLTAKSKEIVTILSSEYFFESRSLEYQMAEPGRVGIVHSAGPGRMLRSATKENEEFRAQWSKQLDIQRGQGINQIDLQGNVQVWLDAQTDIKSDNLTLWLSEQQLSAFNPETGVRKTAWEYRPLKLAATDQVIIQSTELNGRTNQLTASWPQPAHRPDRQQQGGNVDLPTRHTTGRTIYQRQEPSGNLVAPKARPKFAAQQTGYIQEPPATGNRFDFLSDRVELTMTDDPDNPTFDHAQLKGNVQVTQIPQNGSETDPVKITGHRLDMKSQSAKSNYKIVIVGNNQKPARIHSNQLDLDGPTIHFDQLANKIWVVGAGKMNLTGQISPNQSANDSIITPGQTAETRMVDVNWQSGMIFDGQQIYFERDVVMTTSQIASTNLKKRNVTKSISQALKVNLKKRVEFSRLSGSTRHKPEIDEIVLIQQIAPAQSAFKQVGFQKSKPKNQLVVENLAYDQNNNLVEQLKVVAPHASINADSGEIVAAGPGILMMHRMGKSSFRIASPIGPQKQSTSNQENSIAFTRINFDKSLTANSDTQNINIVGNVRAIYSPVKDWNVQINPDRVKQVPEGGVKITCDQIVMEQWSPRDKSEPQTEVTATGNTYITGDLFRAVANKVRYTQVTDILTIEGSPRSMATLFHRQSRGGTETRLTAAKALYRLSDQMTKILDVQNMTIDSNKSLINRGK